MLDERQMRHIESQTRLRVPALAYFKKD
jgi:hypothetical protein